MDSSQICVKDHFPLENWQVMDEFLSKAYSETYVMRHKDLFKWTFQNTNREDLANVVCAYRKEEIIAITGYLITDLFWGRLDRIVTGAWPINWITVDNFRFGVGWPLIRCLQDKFDVLLMNGPSQENKRIVPKLGFKLYNKIPRYVGIFDPNSVTVLLSKGDRYVEDPVISKYTLNKDQLTGYHDVRVIAGKVSDHDYNPEWSMYPALRYGVIRSAEYLNRKYSSHPYFDYKIIMGGDRYSPSLCVYRIEKTSGIAKVRVGRIVEFFHPQTDKGFEEGISTLAFALLDLMSGGCIFCDYYCSSDQFIRVFNRIGLYRENKKILPHRLNPIEFQDPTENLDLEIYDSFRKNQMPYRGELYITKSDGDQDRPNMPYLGSG